MVEIKDRPISSGLNELEKTFQEYKKKLEHTEVEAQQIIDLAWKKADSIFKESQSKAQKMADEMMQAAKANSVTLVSETGRLIDEVSQKAETVLVQFQARLHSEFAELITKVDKSKNTPDKQSLMTKNEGSAGSNQKNGNDNSRVHRKLMVLPPFNEVQIKKLADLLRQIPGIKIEGTAPIEDNFSINISFFETIPVQKILADSSLIESSELKGDIIKLKLKANKTGSFEHQN